MRSNILSLPSVDGVDGRFSDRFGVSKQLQALNYAIGVVVIDHDGT